MQETGLRQTEAHVHQNGLENDGGDLAGVFAEAALDAAEIVEGGDNHVGERGFRDARTSGNTRGRVGIAVIFGLGLDADEGRVVQTVIRALKLQDFVATGSGTGDAAGVHGHFGTAGTETHHFDGIAFANFFGEFPFLIVRHAKGGAAMELLLDGFDHGGMAMPGHERTETEIVINVFVAVEVVNPAGFPVFHEDRIRLVMSACAFRTWPVLSVVPRA